MKRTAAIFFLILFCGIVCADDPAVDAARFLNDLKNSSPVLYERLVAEKDLLPRMMQSIVPGLAVAPETPPPQPEKQRLYPARLLYGNIIFYTRLDRIDEESLQNLMEEMRTTARLANRPVGAILDLRSAVAGDFECVERFVSLFTVKPDRKRHFFQKIPLVVLCGSRTDGPGELLTILLERSNLGISLGVKGKGNIFPRREAVLNGTRYLVPQIPVFAKDVPMGAHTPMIECAVYPQIPFDRIGKDPVDQDLAIRRGADLLRSLHAIRGK